MSVMSLQVTTETQKTRHNCYIIQSVTFSKKK